MTRNSSFELLRLILMAMVVLHHSILFGVGLTGIMSLPPDLEAAPPRAWWPMAIGMEYICICAVDCFILISGYFGIRTSLSKIATLLFALLFYAFTLNAVPYAMEGDFHSALRSMLFLSHSSYWFVIDYLFLMAFTPLINEAFETKPAAFVYTFTGALAIISIYFGFLWEHQVNSDGYTLMQFIFMYCIGRIIRHNDIRIGKVKALAAYIGIAVLAAAIMYILAYSGDYLKAGKVLRYNDPLVITSAILLMLIFKDLRFESRIINRIARSAFGIYLFHSSIFVSERLYPFIRYQKTICENIPYGGLRMTAIVTATVITVVLFSLLYDRIRLFLSDRLLPPLLTYIHRN